MLFRGYYVLGNLCPWVKVVAVEVAKLETCYQQTAEALVKVCYFDVTATYGCWQVLVF